MNSIANNTSISPESSDSAFLLPTSTNLDNESVTLSLDELRANVVVILKDNGPSNEAFQ